MTSTPASAQASERVSNIEQPTLSPHLYFIADERLESFTLITFFVLISGFFAFLSNPYASSALSAPGVIANGDASNAAAAAAAAVSTTTLALRTILHLSKQLALAFVCTLGAKGWLTLMRGSRFVHKGDSGARMLLVGGAMSVMSFVALAALSLYAYT